METKSDRRLGAVVFTDIVDFTKLMSEDESKALETLQKKIILFIPKWLILMVISLKVLEMEVCLFLTLQRKL